MGVSANANSTSLGLPESTLPDPEDESAARLQVAVLVVSFVYV
jgi:hypothetical protein